MSDGGAENGGEPMAGTAGKAGGSAGKGGGSSQAGSANAGMSSGGTGQAGEMNQGGLGPMGDGGTSEGGAGGQGPAMVGVNAVYTMSNAAAGNKVLGFLRADDGTLTPMAAPFDTTGLGTGAGLGEQGAVAYDAAAQRLYVVNAGHHSFTVFRVQADGSLGNAKKVTTAGFGDDGASLLGPKSITFRGDTVYVLFQGNANVASKSLAGR